MLMIACQEEVGLEQPVNQPGEGQDIIVQGFQLAPECPCLRLRGTPLGIDGGGLDRR
jgi:hypothetical protein